MSRKRKPAQFNYKVMLVPLSISNSEQSEFRKELNSIPYLLYEVEQITTGEKIAINKPGGKRNFGRFAQNDLVVYIYTPKEDSLWIISHNEIFEDLQLKHDNDEKITKDIIKGLYRVCQGEEPDDVIKKLSLTTTHTGISNEILLKVYKWIWGQEDCNYPNGEGRWLSMNGILKKFGYSAEDMK